MAADAGRLLAAHRRRQCRDRRSGRWRTASRRTEPYDAIIVEGGIELLPQALVDQLKPGGRIAAIFVDGSRGQARLGLRAGDGIAWRRIFDATAPLLPGFAATKAFEF